MQVKTVAELMHVTARLGIDAAPEANEGASGRPGAAAPL
jgi:hypothetical protein